MAVDLAADNFSRMRRLALNLLRSERTVHVRIKGERRRAGWDRDCLLRVSIG